MGGGDAISLMFVDLWLECAIQQLRNVSFLFMLHCSEVHTFQSVSAEQR